MNISHDALTDNFFFKVMLSLMSIMQYGMWHCHPECGIGALITRVAHVQCL